MGLFLGSSQVISSKWKSQHAPKLSFDTILILLSDMAPLGRSGVCAVEVRLLDRKTSSCQQQSQLASSGKEISLLAGSKPVCYWRPADDTRELPISNFAQTDKKFSTDSLPASSNDNRLYSNLLVIPTWQWLSFLKESQSFFPRRCIS